MLNEVVVGLGSNIRPEVHVPQALALLAERYSVMDVSQMHVTKPCGNPNQPDFVNGAVLLQTFLDEDTLAQALKDLEQEMGRPVGEDKNDPRIIDLDILLWNGIIIDFDVYKRGFLQDIIQELCPDFNLNEKKG